jgi:Hint module
MVLRPPVVALVAVSLLVAAAALTTSSPSSLRPSARQVDVKTSSCDSKQLAYFKTVFTACAGCIDSAGPCPASCCVLQLDDHTLLCPVGKCCVRMVGDVVNGATGLAVLDDLALGASAAASGVCDVNPLVSSAQCTTCATALDKNQKPISCPSGVAVPFADRPFSGTASCHDNAVPDETDDSVPLGGDAPKPSSDGGEADPESSPVDSEANGCFPGDATVRLQSGAVKRMDELMVGDMVHVGLNSYSPVFMFTHQEPDTVNAYVRLTTAGGQMIVATPSHYLHTAEGDLTAAGAIKAGDAIVASDGSPTVVVSARTMRVAGGLWNPQTVHGDIVVNGILATTYTTAVAPVVAHAALATLRFLYNSLGLYTDAFSVENAGTSAVVYLTPNGASSVY